jgi:uncharacterized protein YxjI
MLAYPLTLNFKLLALAPRIRVHDASGREILYVHQKTLALKEDVRIYSDESKSRELYRIKADRVFDFSARYTMTDSATEQVIGAIKHRGMRSIWKATYEIYDPAGQVSHVLTEDNPWVKVLDVVAGEIPFVSMFTGYFLNPTYTMHQGSEREGAGVLHLVKRPAFFESNFTIEHLGGELSTEVERRLILGIVMAVQMERSRG